MDLGWISMDLDLIFYGFHGSEVDLRWNSWISARFPWIWHGFSTDFMDVGWISMDLDWIFYRFHGSEKDLSWNSWFFGWISMFIISEI